jgi:hypothetical protein
VDVHSGVLSGPVDVVLRPDAARLDETGSIRARVVAAVFTGTHVELSVGAESGPPLTVVVAPGRAPAVGAEVRVTLDPDALLVYPRRAD